MQARSDKGLAWVLVGLGLAWSLPVAAQDVAADDGETTELVPFHGPPRLTVSVHGGGSGFGRFLLQSTNGDGPDFDQRELSGDLALSYGGTVGLEIVRKTDVRLGFTRATTDLAFEDDRGVGSDALEDDDVAELSSNVLTVELIRQVLPMDFLVTPYVGVGGALALWDLHDDDTNGVRPGDDDEGLLARIGGVGILGAEVAPADNLGVRLEVATLGLGNPFTGERSLVADGDLTVDEPKRVPQIDVRLGLAYAFGEPRRRVLRPVARADDEGR